MLIMDFEIVHCNHVYNIKGRLNKDHIRTFKKVFNHALRTYDTITISIEELKHIDKHGVKVLTKLHKKALYKHKKLYIVGLGCEDLYHHFAATEVA